MKKFLSAAAIVVALNGTAHAQDFDKGLAAAQSGDYATALQEWRPLAEQGNALAQYNLGFMYDNGYGVPQDYVEAVKWYRLAAEQGNAEAQASLGFMYKSGYGVPQDYAEAAKWYRLAAEQGNARAQTNLGFMYANGYGVPQDSVMAHRWFNIASANGLADAPELRDSIAQEMTPQDISTAQAMATECLSSNYQNCGY